MDRRTRARTRETVSETPANNYINSGREREYLAALQAASIENQSLRALLAGILIEGETGTLTVATESVLTAPNYVISIESDDTTITLTLSQAQTEEEPNDSDSSDPSDTQATSDS